MVKKLNEFGHDVHGKMAKMQISVPLNYVVSIAHDLFGDAMHYYKDLDMPGSCYNAMDKFKECIDFCLTIKDRPVFKKTVWHESIVHYEILSEIYYENMAIFREQINSQGWHLARLLREF